MRAWIGSRIDDGTTAVFAIERSPRPSMEEVSSVLGELRRLNDGPADPAQDAAVLARKRDLLDRIEASERVGEVIPLHPASGRQFDWGEDSPVGFELARAVLSDAVGDPPPHHVVDRYVADVVAHLPHDRFRIEAADVHEWLVGQELFVEAELAAHRGGLDPDRGPALHIAAPDEAPGASDGRAADPVPDPATASALVAACEQAWAEIQRHHPDVPHAVVVLGSGVEGGRLVKLGHWWGGRWLADDEVRGEVLLAGEALHLPAEQVFEVLLHEAAHGLNAALDVKDTSRGGRYHNKRFRMTAELVGLDVSVMPPYGWARTELSAEAVERYREAIDSLGDAMRIARRVERRHLGAEDAEVGGGPSAGDRQAGSGTETTPSGTARCGCGRRMRMAPSVLAAGPVVCGLCGNEFQLGRTASRSAGPVTDEQRQDHSVDQTFLVRRREALAAERAATSEGPLPRLGAFLAAAREAGYAAHPAVVALAHRHQLLADAAGPEASAPTPELTPTQQAGLTDLVMAGDKPGDWAVVSWYQALGTEHERPMVAGNLAEAGRRRNLARAMLKADGTLQRPAVEVAGREFLAGDRVVVGPSGIGSLDLDAGVPGSVEQVDPAGAWFEVDFPTAGHYRLTVDSPEATALTYGYAEIIHGVEYLDLRTLDLRPPIEAQPVPTVGLPEIEL
jgi:hypothetical protein